MGRSLVQGVGINDYPTSVSYYEDGKKKSIKEYKLWSAMLGRCYSEYVKRNRPTYENVTCDDRWLRMSDFILDVSELHGYNKALHSNWVLDKDILVKGNNCYSKEMCCFVPPEINGTLTLRKRFRGDLPLGVGVDSHSGKYKARCGFDGKRLALGLFETPQDAFHAYVIAKKGELKRLADKYREDICPKVYQALLEYDFSIED